MPKRKNITLANLSPQQVKLLTAIHRKYHDEWGQWLEKLMWSFSDKQGNPREGREEFVENIDMLRGYVKMIGRLIDRLISKYAISDSEMTELFGAIREVKERIAEMVQIAKKDREIQQDMDEVQEETGVSFEGIEETHKLASRQMKALGKAPRKESRFPVPESLKQLGAGIGRGIETALLGPFAPLVEQATGTIRGFVREFKERKARKGASRLAAGLGGNPEETQKLESGLLREQRQSPFMRGAMPGGIGREEPSREEPRENVVAGGMGKSSVGVRAASGSLFEFFDSLAFEAKWTKQLLEAVTNIAGVEPGKELSGRRLSSRIQGAISGAIGFALAGLKVALVVAVGAAIGTAIGNWLGDKKIGEKTVDEHVTGFFDSTRKWWGESPSNVNKRYDKEESPRGNVAQRMGELSQAGYGDLSDAELRRFAADDLERRGIITYDEKMNAYATATRIKQFQKKREAGGKLGQLDSKESVGPKKHTLSEVDKVQSYELIKTSGGQLSYKESTERPVVGASVGGLGAKKSIEQPEQKIPVGVANFKEWVTASDKVGVEAGGLGHKETPEQVEQSEDKAPIGISDFKERLKSTVQEETIGEIALNAKAIEGAKDKELLELLHQDNEEVITSMKKMITAYEKQKEVAIGESGEDVDFDVDPLLRSVSEGGLF